MTQPQRVKAADVAREAGVSTATVSYVLNNAPGQSISKETTARVHSAAERLGYVANPAARTLARGKSGFVIIYMSVFVTQESAAIAATPVINILRGLGYEVFMAWWPDDAEQGSGHDRLTSFARATTPEAIISILPLPNDVQARLRTLGVPSISSLVTSFEELAPAVAVPVATQVEYLAERGHTHIFYAAGGDPSLDPFVSLRGAAGARESSTRSVTWDALPRHSTVPELAGSIEAAMARTPEATAIAAYNDDDALAALFALYLLGVKVPDRMAVIGIDNDKTTELAHPKLTSVSFEFDLSIMDPELLLATINSRGTLGLVQNFDAVITPRVHVRESA